MDDLRLLLRRQATAAWRYRWFAVLASWLICAVGWSVVLTVPNIYESSARLYVDVDMVLTPLLHGLAFDSSLSSQVDILQRTLLSRPNLEKLISKTDLELAITGRADLERTVEQLATEIKITPQTTNLFTIVYRNPSPKLAYDVVQTMLSMFVESKTGHNRVELENAAKFLQQQIDSYERQLREAEKKRADFRTKYVDVLPAGDGGASRLEGAQGAVRSLQGALEDANAKRATLQHELDQTPPLVVTETDGPGGSRNSQLRTAERSLQELRLRYTDQHPDVVAARNLIAAIKSGAISSNDAPVAESSAAAHNRSLPNPIYEQLKVRLVENDSTISSLKRQLGEATADSDRLENIARGAPGLQAEQINLNRDYDVLRKNYEELLSRRESMRIGTAADADSDKVKIQVVDPPQVPQNPVAPKRVLLLSGVLAAGLVGGIGLAFLLVQFDQSFHSVDDLNSLGLPVVGGVSLLAVASSLRRRIVPAMTFAVALLLLCAVYGGLLYRILKPGAFA